MNNKFFYTFALLIFVSASAFAQSKTLDDSYNRNSVSKLWISFGDNFDNTVKNAYANFSFGEKYDYNDLDVTAITTQTNRGDATVSNVLDILNNQNFGKSIVSYWFNRNSEGMMNDEMMRQRSLYNVNDEDVMIAAAAKVSNLADRSDALIRQSYIVVFNTNEIKREQLKDPKTGKVSVLWQAKSDAYVYQIDIDSTFIEDLYMNMWIQDDDTPEVKAAKKQLYDSLQVNMKTVASVSGHGASTVSEKNPEESAKQSAVSSSFEALLFKMENAIPDWQVKVAIHDVHPIRSKIGTKENLKNTDRYRVYYYFEDKNGHLKTRPKGYIRVTTIADNESIASGETPMSRFYQISGGRLEPGMLMVEKKDRRMGISAGVKYHGANSFFIDLDFLMHINDLGFCSYPFASIGFDQREEFYANLAIGYGHGIPLTRLFELMPFAGFGIDYMAHENVDEDKIAQYTAFFAEAGARFSIQPVYPIRVFVQADYSLNFLEGIHYETGENRFGVGLSIGLRYAF